MLKYKMPLDQAAEERPAPTRVDDEKVLQRKIRELKKIIRDEVKRQMRLKDGYQKMMVRYSS